MLQLNPDKNWVICLFVYALWQYIVAASVVYAINQGFSTPRYHSK